MKEQNTYFDPDTSFFGLKIVKFTALSFIATFMVMCSIIIYHSELWGEWSLTHVGFNNLLDYFKVPLGFLALAIPTGAVFAANHRSEQTKKQIVLTNKQNLFINYYKHIEEFEKFTEKRLEPVLKHKVLDNLITPETTAFDVRQYHKALFPELLHTGSIKVDGELISKLEAHLNIPTLMRADTIDSLNKVSLFFMYCINDLAPILIKHHLAIGKLMLEGAMLKNILIKDYKKTQLKLMGKEECESLTVKCACYSIIDSIERIYTTLKIIDTCAKFDTSYETMQCLQMIERLKATLKMGSMSQLKMSPEIGITQVLRLELFSDDETPDNVPFRRPEDRICHKTLEHGIKYSINDLVNQYAESTDDLQTSLVVA